MKAASRDVLAVLAGTLQRQRHVITRHQALSAGLSAQMLKRRLRAGGPWQKLLPGVYLALTGIPTPEQKEMATLLYAGPGSVITGAAALRREGLPAPPSEIIDVLIPNDRKRRSTGFARVLRTTRMPDQVAVIAGRHYTMPARAVADAAHLMINLRDVRQLVASAVQTRRCTLDMLLDELASGPQRGSTPLRLALAEVAEGIRSVAEADLRDLIRRAGIPAPFFNASLYDATGALLAVADAWWPDAGVVTEVDSRAWHLSPQDWERTSARHARMTAHGILVLHFTPQQIRTQPNTVIAAIKDALAAGLARPPLPIQTRPAAA